MQLQQQQCMPCVHVVLVVQLLEQLSQSRANAHYTAHTIEYVLLLLIGASLQGPHPDSLGPGWR
jgi:hypothetical protein